MEHSSGIQASLSGRYATALFELARDSGSLDQVGASLATVKQALAESADLKALTTSPSKVTPPQNHSFSPALKRPAWACLSGLSGPGQRFSHRTTTTVGPPSPTD